MFFIGAVYEFTYNEKGKFSQSQLGVLIQLPEIEDNGSFEKVSIYVAPPGIKEYVYSPDHDAHYFESNGWTKETIGCVPERIHALANSMRGKRRQYGLKHRVTATIHGCQGDTLHKLVTQICGHGLEFTIWDKAQVVVLLSRTRRAHDIIFVGDPEATIKCLIEKMVSKSQNTDYMEKVITVLDCNQDENEAEEDAGEQHRQRAAHNQPRVAGDAVVHVALHVGWLCSATVCQFCPRRH